MNRNEYFPAPRQFKVWLAFAIIFLLAACGKSQSRPHSVTVSWTTSTSPVAGYNVYRTLMPDGPRIKLTPQPVTLTQYVDSRAAAGQTYSYAVTSVDPKGNESSPSATIVVTVPKP
jgi:fibronectin type 3 domain-containing protein